MLKPKKARKETYTNIADLGQLNDMNELMYLDDGTSEITIKALLGRAYLRVSTSRVGGFISGGVHLAWKGYLRGVYLAWEGSSQGSISRAGGFISGGVYLA